MDKQIWEVHALLNQDYNEVKAAVLNYWKADATEEQIEDLIERFVERSERTVETVKAVWGTELEEYRYMKKFF